MLVEISPDISNGREQHPIPLLIHKSCLENCQNQILPTFKYVTKTFINLTQNLDQKSDESNQFQLLRLIEVGRLATNNLEDQVFCDCKNEVCQISCHNLNINSSIYFCGDFCSCNSTLCCLRLSNFDVSKKINFEVFAIDVQGSNFGLRCKDPLPKEKLIGPYAGEIISNEESLLRDLDDYYFKFSEEKEEDLTRLDTIDARFYGNFTRFINHSCQPNLKSVKIYDGHTNTARPEIYFMALKDIEIDEELTFDYGNVWWSAKLENDENFKCFCQSENCRYK